MRASPEAGVGMFASGGMGVLGQDFPEISGGAGRGVLLRLALFLTVYWPRQG